MGINGVQVAHTARNQHLEIKDITSGQRSSDPANEISPSICTAECKADQEILILFDCGEHVGSLYGHSLCLFKEMFMCPNKMHFVS